MNPSALRIQPRLFPPRSTAAITSTALSSIASARQLHSRLSHPRQSTAPLVHRTITASAPPTSSPATFPVTQRVQRVSHQIRTMAGTTPNELRFKNPAILVCDMQDKFRNVIYEFDSIVTTTTKLLSFAQAVNIPIHATTQTVAKLGPTVPALAKFLPSTPHDKTKFSMLIPPLAAALPAGSRIALVGIESHICITQTALDLRDAGHIPYVIADAVSSCNKTEVIIALDRLRAEPGIIVTSSESWMYECLGDAGNPAFKSLIGVVKGSVTDTKKVLESLPPTSKI